MYKTNLLCPRCREQLYISRLDSSRYFCKTCRELFKEENILETHQQKKGSVVNIKLKQSKLTNQ